jgi:hypothetical protein
MFQTGTVSQECGDQYCRSQPYPECLKNSPVTAVRHIEVGIGPQMDRFSVIIDEAVKPPEKIVAQQFDRVRS